MSRRAQPIGIFDSGVGGLTVLRALIERLPNESTVYLGDTARVPYGTKSAEVVTRYSLKNAQFLVDRDIKLLVVACNTASAFALPALRKALSVPVVGVIEPGARAAAQKTKTGRVGVIGTPGTIQSGAYQRSLEAVRSSVEVFSQACPLFVPLAEEGWTDGEVPRLVAKKYLGVFRAHGVDTLVLGCTHYPLLRTVISEVVGEGIALVDSAEATAAAVVEMLKGDAATGSAQPAREFFVTDVPNRFVEVGERFLGRRLEHAEQVDISFG
jgi:glutamate racemase